MRSLMRLLDVSPGFNADRVAAMRIAPGDRRERGPKMIAFFDEILERVKRLPGVQSAALVVNLPLDRNMWWDISIPGKAPDPAISQTAAVRMVSPGYFQTLSIQMKAGRDFNTQDGPARPLVAIVNQTLARAIAGLREPLNSKVRVGGTREHEIVGVVSDVKHQGLHAESGPELYLVHSQVFPFPQVDLVVRSSTSLGTLAAAVRREVWAVDPNQPVGKTFELGSLLEKSLSPRRFYTAILGAFAAFALLLACTGVYGVVSYNVERRTQEIGVRMALGAGPAAIRRMIVLESFQFAAIGLAVGLAGAAVLSRVLSGQLYGLTAADPITYVATAAFLLASIGVASYVPANRATRLDPRAALASE
ncbi:MAG: FtsX-like permease family protein [Bryobacteraceae bacterium]